jgi:uncharacterized protein YqgC (DUF456 family)
MDIYLVWSLTAVLTLIGLAGVVVPLLPGTTLILVAMVVHKLLLPGDVSWVVIGWVAAFWLLSVVIDFLGVILGTRLFGGGKWGMLGAGGGAAVGMFFSLPMLVLGTVLGAVAAERLIAQKSHRTSLMAGAGAAFGFLLSTVGRLLCAFAMIILFLIAALGATEAPAIESAF